MNTHLSRRAGMTLIETVIVLGVVALVMSGIWIAASAVRENQGVNDAIEVVTETASRVRSQYLANPIVSADNLGNVDTKSVQITRGLFPEHVTVDASIVRNYWGGDVGLKFKLGNGNVVKGFTVSMLIPTTVSASSRNHYCLAMISALQGAARTTVSPTGDPPLPNVGDIPAQDLTAEGGPVYVFAKGGSWFNASNRTPTDTIAQIGSGGCQGVAFYFNL